MKAWIIHFADYKTHASRTMLRHVGLYVDVLWRDFALYSSRMILLRNVQVSLMKIFVKSLIVIT